MSTDLPAHRYDHALAFDGGIAFLEVVHQVFGHFFYAWLGADQFFQGGPFALGLFPCTKAP